MTNEGYPESWINCYDENTLSNLDAHDEHSVKMAVPEQSRFL